MDGGGSPFEQEAADRFVKRAGDVLFFLSQMSAKDDSKVMK